MCRRRSASRLRRWAAGAVEEYIFYLTGFLEVLLLYIWLDEYWLALCRSTMMRTNRLRSPSAAASAVSDTCHLLILAAILYKRNYGGPGFPDISHFWCSGIVAISMFLPGPSMINWRAVSLTVFMVVLISLLWEVTLALPYGW